MIEMRKMTKKERAEWEAASLTEWRAGREKADKAAARQDKKEIARLGGAEAANF